MGLLFILLTVNRKCLARNTTAFQPLHRPWAPQCPTFQTDRQTDGRQYHAKSYVQQYTIG